MRFIRKINYVQDINIVKHSGHLLWYGLLLALMFSGPLWLDRYLLGEFALVFIYAIAGLGLMILVGYTGLVSLGHAAFLAIGAYTHAYLLNLGVPLPIAMLCATTSWAQDWRHYGGDAGGSSLDPRCFHAYCAALRGVTQ